MKISILVAISSLIFTIGIPVNSASAKDLYAGSGPNFTGNQPNYESSGNPYPLPLGPPPVPEFLTPQATKSTSHLPLAGNVMVVSQGESGSDCTIIGLAKTVILTATFKTGEVNKYVEINYSGQFNMGSSSANGFNRMFLQCAIRLASAGPEGDTACTAMTNAYIPTRRPRIGDANFSGITNVGAYIGYVSGLAVDTEYTVTMYSYTAATPANDIGQVCYSNMILRY